MHRALAPGAHSIAVDGIVQRYHVHGTGPICVVHPGGPGLNWEHVRLRGLENTNTMVYVEPIGTGESGRLPATDRYTLARYASHLRAVVDATGGDGAALLGYGHGGLVAQQYLTTYPDGPHAVVLVCSTPAATAELVRETGDNLARFAERHARQGEAGDVEAAYLDVLTATDDRTMTQARRRLFPAYFRDYWNPDRHAGFFKLRSSLTAWAAPSSRGGAASADFRDRLGRVRTPALIVAGAWDPLVSPRWSRALEVSLPGSRLVEFGMSAHLPHLEEPDAFRRTVADFLSR